MRFLLPLAAIGLAALPVAAEATQRNRDQDAAFRAVRQGQILPLSTIRTRVHVPNAEFIGADIDPHGMIYRLKFMRDGEVIWVDIDARTGRTVGRSR